MSTHAFTDTEREERSRAKARVRRRRSYHRKRYGDKFMQGDVPADVVEALVKNGWLSLDEAEDPQKLASVLVDLADCWMRGTLEPEGLETPPP